MQTTPYTISVTVQHDGTLAIDIKREVAKLLRTMENVATDGHRKRGLALAANSLTLSSVVKGSN